jgi:hypothetical protein
MCDQAEEAYRKAGEAFNECRGYCPSPYTPWSVEDLAWERAMDDLSGDYVATTPIPPSPSTYPLF